jgi:WD40 repeat protein
VSFSPDETRIVSGSDEKTVWLRDVAAGQPVSEPLEGHTFVVTSVSFSPDGTCIISCSRWDRTARVSDGVVAGNLSWGFVFGGAQNARTPHEIPRSQGNQI